MVTIDWEVGRTALDLYLEERGGALDEAGRTLVESERASWFSVHEVIAAEPGQSMTLRDLLAGRLGAAESPRSREDGAAVTPPCAAWAYDLVVW